MPINLPQFTFLCGRLGQGQIPLMRELVAQDDQVIRLDFTYPIHEFLNQLFPESCPAILDPLEHLDHGLLGYPPVEAPKYDFPELGKEDVRTFLIDIDDGLRNLFGEAALGVLAARHIKYGDLTQNFRHLLFTDAINRYDIEYLMKSFSEFDRNDFLCIHLGDFTAQGGTDRLPCRHIWLAMSDTKSRLLQLQKDLNHDRRPNPDSAIADAR